MHNDFTSILLLIYVSAVACVDLRQHRIPNLLSLSAGVLGLLLQTAYGQGLVDALAGFAVALGIFLPLYVLRAFGAGDVKAMAIVGVFLGPSLAALAAGFTLIAGGVIGVLLLLARGLSVTRMAYRVLSVFLAPTALMHRVEAGAKSPSDIPTAASALKFPYGIAIAVGTAATLLWAGRLQSIFVGV